MKNYASNRVRNVVLLGHSGSGKTTYAEAALYYSGATKRFGKVEDGNTVSDYEAEEIRRKVSINTSVIPVEWQDTKINFLDTPGYFDFAAEVKLAMNVADTGLIMVSAKSGVEVGTEKAWEYCEEMHLPRIIFINQMDDENADFEKTLADLRKNFGKAVAPLQIPFNDENGNFIGFINLVRLIWIMILIRCGVAFMIQIRWMKLKLVRLSFMTIRFGVKIRNHYSVEVLSI